jgi:hypothetical protein
VCLDAPTRVPPPREPVSSGSWPSRDQSIFWSSSPGSYVNRSWFLGASNGCKRSSSPLGARTSGLKVRSYSTSTPCLDLKRQMMGGRCAVSRLGWYRGSTCMGIYSGANGTNPLLCRSPKRADQAPSSKWIGRAIGRTKSDPSPLPRVLRISSQSLGSQRRAHLTNSLSNSGPQFFDKTTISHLCIIPGFPGPVVLPPCFP